jgi:hypothetical protein
MASIERLFPEGAGDPGELHSNAADEAADWSYRVATGGYLGFPWGAVNAIVGPLLPGWLVLVGGRGKAGKSTFLRETFNSWVSDFGKRVLYVGTEQGAGILKLLWAALRLQAPAEAAIDPKHPRHMECLNDVQQGQAKIADRAIIVAEPDLTIDGFVRWARYAYREKCDVLMLDHFHRLEVGNARDGRENRAAAIRRIKNVAAQSNMLIVAAAQMKNGEGGTLGEYEVPGSNAWAETAELRREADVAVQVWRPFRGGVTRKEKQAARDDPAKLVKIVAQNTMAVRCDAHRYRDAAPYMAARLRVTDGQISSWSPDADEEE